MRGIVVITVILTVSSGAYVRENEEDLRCTGKNEVVHGCGACDGTCYREAMCYLMCREPSCGCKSGYVRDSNRTCIHQSQCKCTENERLYKCGACDASCKYPRDSAPLYCRGCRQQTCGCAAGYVRDDNKKCIPKSQCPKRHCPPNMQHYPCGPCDSTCENLKPDCSWAKYLCKTGDCGCSPGFVRNKLGDCVLPSDCPSR